MRPTLLLPWSGALDWQALRPYRRFLARRVGDRDQWVIGVGEEGAPTDTFPRSDGSASFGHLRYERTDELEGFRSRSGTSTEMAMGAWWTPVFHVLLGKGKAELHAQPGKEQEGEVFLRRLLAPPKSPRPFTSITWERRTPRDRYLRQVEALLAHAQRGDIYEVNYCTERTARWEDLDPYQGFARLLAHTDAPFAALHREGDHFALCASPERFLRVEGDRLITQPIKGTRPRSTDRAVDLRHAVELANDAKERSENIMAVDVARHDLSRIAASRSVRVEELCAVKTYSTVHQLVSTVSAQVRAGADLEQVLRATFPMASMTGAPKRRAMELIDEAEDMRRGLFSGTLGFVLPDGTADLNVVIRTLTYDAATGHASLISGGAITAASDPQQEWEECEVKARSVLQAFGHA